MTQLAKGGRPVVTWSREAGPEQEMKVQQYTVVNGHHQKSSLSLYLLLSCCVHDLFVVTKGSGFYWFVLQDWVRKHFQH